jgi:protein-disulfide isomerase
MTWSDELGLDRKQFEACLEAPQTLEALKKDMEQGYKAGLESTPTFFVNGRMVKGAIDETRLKLLLREIGQ